MKLINGIEKIIGTENTNKLTQNPAYRFIADGIANNVFSLVYIFNERYGADLSWEDAGKARVAAAVGNMITGRPYGIYKDWVNKKLGVDENTHWFKRYLVDTASFATGQSWIYAMYLAAPTMGPEIVEGAMQTDLDTIIDSYKAVDWGMVARGASFLTVLAPALGTPQNATYNFIRSQLGAKKKED